jgi:hypothetical protein
MTIVLVSILIFVLTLGAALAGLYASGCLRSITTKTLVGWLDRWRGS